MSHSNSLFRSLASDALPQSKSRNSWQNVCTLETNLEDYCERADSPKVRECRYEHLQRVRYESKLLQENAFLKLQLSQTKIELDQLLHSTNKNSRGPALFRSLAPKKYIQMSSDDSSCGLFSEAPTVRTGSARKSKENDHFHTYRDHADTKRSCLRSFIFGKRNQKVIDKAEEHYDQSRRNYHVTDLTSGSYNQKSKKEGRDDYNDADSRNDVYEMSLQDSSRGRVGMKQKKSHNLSLDFPNNRHHRSQYYDRKYEEIEANQSRLPVIYESPCNKFNRFERVEL